MFRIFVFGLSMIILFFAGTIQAAAVAEGVFSSASANLDRGNSGEQDPCEQLLAANGNANGLHKRCDAVGTGGGAAKGDFNKDGFADLAVGVPHEDVNGVGGVGAVNIIYGSATGLTGTASQVFYETDFGFSLATSDHFGSALASGDFNGDGFSDLAIGMPDRDTSTFVNAGKVLLINGSSSGLNSASARTLSLLIGGQGSAGAALVWADFNGDGFGDLAVGIPGKQLTFYALTFFDTCESRNYPEAGEVQVFYGSQNGLTSTGAQRFHRSPDPICNQSGASPGEDVGGSFLEDRDRFGSVLGAGDFGGARFDLDTAADLVIGDPFDDGSTSNGSTIPDSGRVYIIPGRTNGLRAADTESFSQGTPNVGGAPESGDQFGRSVATGDFDGDGQDDLAVGVPFEDLVSNTQSDAGAVQVFFGDGSGHVALLGSVFISQENLSGTAAEAGDRFGWSLAVGRFNDDGLVFAADSYDDLAIGSPGEDINSIVDAGIVHVLYGSDAGLSLTNAQIWHQNVSGIPGSAETGDQFGYALSAWDYGRTRESDLAIGVPFEDVFSDAANAQEVDAGAVNLIYGTPAGLRANSSNTAQFWTQDSTGVPDAAQVGDHFGEALY